MSFLYAVRMLIPGLDPQPIKVGFSTVPKQRKQTYGSGPYRCEWLGIWPGTQNDELTFHMRFMELNKGLAGEWFMPNAEFMEAINRKIAAYQRKVDRVVEQRRERLNEQVRREAERVVENEEMRLMAGRVMEEFVGQYGRGSV